MRRKYLVLLIVIWVLFIAVSFLFNFSIILRNNKEVVLNKSKAFFEQILTSRAWNSQHERVYVPVTTVTQPNPYLNDTLRDIVTIDGMQLTMINPAYMTRQMGEINKINYDVQFHITSLNPIRPANKADDWEIKALKLFEEKGTSELQELVKNDSSSYYRYMAPLITEKSCLRCHAQQGYKYGDIRGGISISFPAASYLKAINKHLFSGAVVHLLIIVLGIIGVIIYYRMSNKYYSILKNRNAELVYANATKDKFFSIIAHDLRSPFNSILGLSDLILEKCRQNDFDGMLKMSTILNKSVNQSFDLLNNLLEWSSVQTGRIVFKPDNLQLSPLIEKVVDLHKLAAKKKDIDITYDIPEISLKADINMIHSVLRNLLSNAIKFSYKGGKINISAVENKNEVEISVKDYGIGINKDHQKKMFQLGEDITTLGTNNEKGTGLGLILCKEFIEKHGGKISVESEEEKGSRFYFTIPIKWQGES